MIETVRIPDGLTLDDYGALAHLAVAVAELRAEARVLRSRIGDRKVWMVNSTAQGGGVAEMMPKMVSMLRELGVDVDWLVVSSDREEFFALTKRIHNMIHGEGEPGMSSDEVELYEAVSTELAAELEREVGPDDLLVIHDPQPMGAGAKVAERIGVRSIWRCHIGLDWCNSATRTAWDFLEPYAGPYRHAVFSAAEYIPSYLAGQTSIIHPAIDPLGHKNRELSPHKLVGILVNGGLSTHERHPVLTPEFDQLATRLRPDGSFTPSNEATGIGLLYRPVITQVSRWDRLKGWKPLLEGFVRLRQQRHTDGREPRHRRRLDIMRLVLAGPDPAAIADDPEGKEVLEELVAFYRGLDPDDQAAVALLALPMGSRKENALMVNALQRCSSIVVQNSIREGFGLTVTEAMWKRLPVLGSAACGIRQQIRDGIDGRINPDPDDPEAIAHALDGMMADPPHRELLAQTAQRRVYENFLIFSQLRAWLGQLADLADPPA